MALIKCPECGRENVSDSAATCPTCGFGIKAYYDSLKEEELKRKQYEDEQEKFKQRMSQVEMPEIPIKKFEDITLVIFCFSMTLLVISILLSIILIITNSYDVTAITICSIPFTLGIIGIYLMIEKRNMEYQQKLKMYNIAMKDFERYKRMMVNDQDMKERMKLNVQTSSIVLKCPICNSTNVKRISTLNRAVSIHMTGLASGKIGKQYKCNSCKHMW